jgi:predicted thioesterase
MASFTVTEADTAAAQGSGDVPVLATPRLIGLFEAAAVAALDGKLPDDMTSVGVSVSVDHMAPSAIGSKVSARAVLDAVDDAALEFALEAFDGDTMVGMGTHTRVVVERERFLARVDR